MQCGVVHSRLTMMKHMAIHMESRLPQISEKMNDTMQPEKAPRLYIDTIMPSSALCSQSTAYP